MDSDCLISDGFDNGNDVDDVCDGKKWIVMVLILMVLMVMARLSLNAQCTSQSVEGAKRPSREDQLLLSIHIQNSTFKPCCILEILPFGISTG